MGNTSARNLTTDDYIQKVRQVAAGCMSDRDRRLFNFAKIKIAEEDLDNCKVNVGFQDQQSLDLCDAEGTSGEVYIGYDENDDLKLIWQKCDAWRNFKRFLIVSFKILKSVLSGAVEAIGWY